VQPLRRRIPQPLHGLRSSPGLSRPPLHSRNALN
jgi:hypothetical protein